MHRRVATAAVILGLVVAAFEGTVVTSAMPTIARDLGGLSAYGWVFSAYLAAATVAVLVCGRVADTLGRRPVFLVSMALFLAGSALCGSATSMAALIGFRVVQGLGAGGIQPIAMTITADVFTLEERARVQGLLTSTWGAANFIGPVIGGWIVTHASWRWVFLVNVPVGVVSAALLAASYRDPPRAPVSRVARAMLSNRVVHAGLTGSVFTGAIFAACSAYVPLWMTARAGRDAITAGAALIPLLVGWALGSTFGVRVLVRRGMRTSVMGGLTIAMIGAALLVAVVARGAPIGFAFASLALLGVGLGPASSTSMVGAQASVPWQARGTLTSAVYASRMLGGAIAVAALSNVTPGAPQFVAVAALAVASLAALHPLLKTPSNEDGLERAPRAPAP